MNMMQRTYIGKDMKADKAVSLLFPEIPYPKLMQCFKKKDVKVNSKRISIKDTIKDSDVVTIYIASQNLKTINIVYQDDNIVVINKDKGIKSVGEGSLETLLYESLQKNIYPVHRLDTNTSGLIIYALNEEAQNELVSAFKNKQIEKKYMVKVFGKPNKDHDIFKDYLIKDAENSKVKIVSKKEKSALECITEYELVSSDQDTSILRVTLHTGRTHQIRAHLAYHGLPVVGDTKYGNFELNKKFNSSKQELSSCYIKICIKDAKFKLYYFLFCLTHQVFPLQTHLNIYYI